MKARACTLAAVAFVAAGVFADITITEPKAGETVSLLYPDQLEFLDLPREMRKVNRDAVIEKKPGAVRVASKGRAKPVVISWSGSAGPSTVKVVRLPDGKVFHESSTTGTSVSIKGRLEIARRWKATVSDGKSTADVEFSTLDRAPRIISLDGVMNARDLGGRIGLNGRRVKQGLILRTGGLNHNAKTAYYTYDEIIQLHKEGKLEKAGTWKSRYLGKEYEAKLKKGQKLDKHFLRLFKHGPKAPGDERLSDADRAYLLGFIGIKSDLDFRDSWECFGMTGSPLGDDVRWFHYNWVSGYGSFVKPNGRASAARAFSVFVDPKNYPIDFHCIGGTDRTGTFAYLLNALLGVDEEELIRDYEWSFISGSGVDKRHYGWLETLLKSAHELPGDTLAEKMKGYFLSLGFTDKEIEDLREFLLEPPAR